MSTTATRIRRARMVDTIGVLAVVTGLLLGLVPGIAPVGPAWASPAVNLDQCANDISNTDTRQSCAWVNGNLNKNSSIYAEGDSVAFRATISGLTAGNYYEIPFAYDLQQAGYIAYDTITAWDHSESGNPLAGVSDVAGGLGSEVRAPIDVNPQTAATTGAPYGVTDYGVSLFGGVWDTTNGAIGHTGADGTIAAGTNNTVESRFVFRFQASGGTVVLAWGGHIALRQDWNPEGYTTGPQDTNGSPYHMRNGTPTGEKTMVGGAYTYNSIGQQDRSLKASAVILPGTLDIIKKDADGNLLSGFSFEVHNSATTSGATKVFECTTGVEGSCRAEDLTAGDYWVKEVGVPAGYVLDTTLKPITVGELATAEVVFTNQRKDYTIDVAPDGRNAVGNTHTFIVTLTEQGSPLAGATIDLAWGPSGAAGAITDVNGDGAATSCTSRADVDGTPDDEAGTCVVTVTSSAAGSGTLTATYDTPFQHDTDAGTATGSTGGDLYDAVTASADKTWVGYVASIERTETNLASNSVASAAGVHVFTVTVKEDEGSGTLTLPGSSVEVAVTWTGAPSGATIVDSDDPLTASDLTCDTALATGTCTFTVDSSTAGAGTITIVGLDGTIKGLDAGDGDEPLTYVSPAKPPVAESGKNLSAVKTWREYRARLDNDAVNPVDDPHKFTVTVEYRETANGPWQTAGSGLFVDWTTGTDDDGSDDLGTSTCDDVGTIDGVCEIWVESSTPGTRTVTLTQVRGPLLPDDATSYTFPISASQFSADASDDAADNVATKTWLDFGARIVVDGKNLVDTTDTLGAEAGVDGSHTFTVTVFREPAPGQLGTDVPDNTRVSTLVEWDVDGTWTDITTTDQEPAGLVGPDTCAAAGTEDSVCTITVNSDTPGRVRITVTGLENYDFGTGAESFTFSTGKQSSATKTWYAYRASIAADGVNLIGDDHPFTVTAEQSSGNDEWSAVPPGTTVTVSESGDGELRNGIDSCTTTDTSGQCTVWVTSTDPGLSTVTVESVSAEDVDDSPTASVANGTLSESPDGSISADKEWIEYFVDIEASATNLTGQEHTFHVTVTQQDAEGLGPVPDGTTVSISDDNTGITPTGTCTTTGTGDDLRTDPEVETNVCTVVVTSSGVDSVEVAVDGVLAKDVDTTPQATFAPGGNGALSVADGGSRSATKDWIAVHVQVSADEVNIAGEYHRFDVDLTIETPDGDVTDHSGATVDVTVSGTTGEVVDDASHNTTCEAGIAGDGEGTTDGRCTVWVRSTGSGELTVTVTGVDFSYGGTDFTGDDGVDLAGSEGVSADQTLDGRQGVKTWRAYRASIEEDGFNRVGDPHPFLVTIEQTDKADPGEQDWGEVPNGTTATVAVTSGPGTIDPNGCADPGTDGGTCSVTLTSAVPGTTVVTVSAISVAHPATGLSAPVDVADDSASKVWIAFRGTIVDDSVNVTGDDHTFHVNVEYTTDGERWAQVPDGSAISISDDSAGAGVGSSDASDCASTTKAAAAGDIPAHVCTVVVDSDASGSLEVSVDSITTEEITANGITTTFDITFGDGELGVFANFDDTDYDATKTWSSYTLDLDPVEAVNLLDGTDEDPEQFHDITVTLTSDNGAAAPVGDQVVDLELSGVGTIVAVGGSDLAAPTTSTTCTTTSVTPAATEQSSTCVVTIQSSVAGLAELDASFTKAIGESDPVTFTFDADVEQDGLQGAEKIWTTFQVLVDPLTDQNIVGNWHVFTVTVQESDLAGGWDPVQGAAYPADLGFTISGTDLTVSHDGSQTGDPTSEVPYCAVGTNADGQCVIAVSSDTVQAITVEVTYTESYDSYNSGTGAAVFETEEAANKEWIDYSLELSANAENLVNTTHTFTVTVGKQTSTSEGAFLGLPGVTPDVEKVSGPGTIIGGTCVTGVTDGEGRCTIQVRSGDAGLTTVRASYLGENASKTESKQLTDTATKLWVNYDLVLSPAEATNAVGDAHTFTATLRVDTGEGLGPAAGEALQFTVGGVGAVTGGDVDGDLACTTDVAGTCDIVIDSDEGGDTDVGVTYAAEVGNTSATFPASAVKHWVDIDLVKTAVVGDGFGDGDLVADPETGLPTLFFTSSDRGPKTAVFEYLLTNTGGGPLSDVALVDDRLGAITLSEDCEVLEVGDSCTARASESFTYQDAAGGLSNIITNVGVVTASGDDGSEVSDTDDAVIQLVAQQSSILLDLVKEVVAGAGDVSNDGGIPTVTWSEAEVDANASKVVRYRFTVTNVGPSPVVDVELVDPMVSGQPLIAVADGVVLQPGDSTVVEVDHLLTAAEAFPDGPTAGEVPNVATVSGANETRDAFDEDADDAVVFVQVVFSEVERPAVQRPAVLPATGLTHGRLLPLSLLLVTIGTAVLWLDRRRTARG